MISVRYSIDRNRRRCSHATRMLHRSLSHLRIQWKKLIVLRYLWIRELRTRLNTLSIPLKYWMSARVVYLVPQGLACQKYSTLSAKTRKPPTHTYVSDNGWRQIECAWAANGRCLNYIWHKGDIGREKHSVFLGRYYTLALPTKVDNWEYSRKFVSKIIAKKIKSFKIRRFDHFERWIIRFYDKKPHTNRLGKHEFALTKCNHSVYRRLHSIYTFFIRFCTAGVFFFNIT